MEKQITTKPKSVDKQCKEMMDRCIGPWDIGKKKTFGELRNEALEKIAFSELEDDAIFNDDDFSDDDSFFDIDDEKSLNAWTPMCSVQTFLSGTIILNISS